MSVGSRLTTTKALLKGLCMRKGCESKGLEIFPTNAPGCPPRGYEVSNGEKGWK